MELHENENCTEYLHKFLNLIQLEMLVVKRTARSDIGVIHTKLKGWYENCRVDEVFCNKPAPWNKSSRRGLSDMPAMVVELSADDRKMLVELDLPKHNGEVVDDNEEVVDDNGEVADDNGKAVDDNEEVVDDNGEVVDGTVNSHSSSSSSYCEGIDSQASTKA
jgi:hypothetical protein